MESFQVNAGPRNREKWHPIMPEPRWPARPEGFREVLQAYYYACDDLGMDLMGLMALELGLPEDYFVPHFDRNMSILTLNYYPPLLREQTIEQGQMRLAGHTDFGMLTILKDDKKAGL